MHHPPKRLVKCIITYSKNNNKYILNAYIAVKYTYNLSFNLSPDNPNFFQIPYPN